MYTVEESVPARIQRSYYKAKNSPLFQILDRFLGNDNPDMVELRDMRALETRRLKKRW